MRTIEALRALRNDPLFSDARVISGIGRAAHGAHTLWGDRNLTFDALGMAIPIALGLAISALDDSMVLSIEGDGSVLFAPGTLLTLAGIPAAKRRRFLAVVIDNQIFESAGGAPTRSFGLDWVALGRSLALPVVVASGVDQVAAAATQATGGLLVLSVAEDEPLEAPVYELNGAEAASVFRMSLAHARHQKMVTPADKY